MREHYEYEDMPKYVRIRVRCPECGEEQLVRAEESYGSTHLLEDQCQWCKKIVDFEAIG